jgi:hypothetical protein
VTSVALLRYKQTLLMANLKTLTLRVSLAALAFWMLPLVASQFVEDWHWGWRGFLMAYVLFFSIGMAIALLSRRMGLWSYKAGVAVALISAFGLAWSTMGHVSGTENPANLWYLSVLGVGLVGAMLARLQPPGLSLTLFAMASTLALISLIVPSGAPPDMALRMAIGHIGGVLLFAAAGLLFRHASMTPLQLRQNPAPIQ